MFGVTRSFQRGCMVAAKAAKAMPKNMMAVQSVSSVRAFSTGNVEVAGEKLLKSLEKEIEYENNNYKQLEDIETFLSESGFAFHESDSTNRMTLTKKIGTKVVEVQFESR